jgi:putative glycosyl hydrolase/Big-like domain-containing protein/hemolysin type calcium-binding protein
MRGGRGAEHGPRVTRFAIVLAALALPLCAVSTAEGARTEFFGIAQGALDAPDAQRIADVGVRTERFMLKWREVESTKGSYDWSARDWLVGALASRGVRPAPFVWGSPQWVGNGAAARPPVDSAADVQAWQTFLKAAVARYGRGGSYWANGYRQRFGADATPLPVQSWQVWNEPNLSKYFDPGQTVAHAAQKYARLLGISHDAIKGEDQQAQIVLAGMPGYGDVTAWKFLDTLYRVSGVKGDFDAAALHPYARDLDRFRRELVQFRAVMKNHGDRATPLWLTELAWGSGPPDQFGHNVGLSRQQQLLSGAFKLVLSRRSAWNVQRIFWFLWHDPPPGSDYATLCSICGTAGLVDHTRSPKPAYYTFKGFTAETTPPVARITAGPSQGSLTDDPTPTFTFASNEPGSTFECRLARGYFPCGSPLTPGPLSDGPHTLYVKAIDAPGNESAVVSRSFTVEARPPAVTISSGPATGSTSSNRSPSFTFTSNEPGSSFSCQLDGGGFEDCSSPFTASSLTEGPHTFQVRATDLAGKQGATVSRAWTVDSTVDLSITGGPDAGSATNDPTPSFSFSSLDSGASFRCRIDADPFAACTSPFTPSPLSDGDHTFTVEATDTTQNTAVASRNFAVDTTAPTVTVSSGPADGSATNDSTPTFRFSSTEAGSTFHCRYEGQGFSACSGASSDTAASPLWDGPHTFGVRAIDAAGNGGEGLDTKFTVDTVAPKVKIKGPSNVKTERNKASAIFTLDASEQVDRRCRIDSRRFRSCSWRYRTPKLGRSAHTLKVKATDGAGNVGSKRKWFTLVRKGVPRRARRAPSHASCHGAAATLIGSRRGDRLTGTGGRDVIVGFGGNDEINARGGRDVICARRGGDDVTAGPGADWVRGGRGSDDLRSGPGRDTIRAGFGFDACGRAPGDRTFHCEVLSLR